MRVFRIVSSFDRAPNTIYYIIGSEMVAENSETKCKPSKFKRVKINAIAARSSAVMRKTRFKCCDEKILLRTIFRTWRQNPEPHLSFDSLWYSPKHVPMNACRMFQKFLFPWGHDKVIIHVIISVSAYPVRSTVQHFVLGYTTQKAFCRLSCKGSATTVKPIGSRAYGTVLYKPCFETSFINRHWQGVSSADSIRNWLSSKAFAGIDFLS